MANATRWLDEVWNARDVAFRALGGAVDREEAARRRLAAALADVRRQSRVTLAVLGQELGYSASMIQSFERGSRWSEGLAFRYHDWARRITSHQSWRDGPAPATDDEGCPVGDPSCTSRDDECHDACEDPRREAAS